MRDAKTTGEIAIDLNVSRDTIQRIIRTRNIEADDIAGNCGLYGPAAVKRIAKELSEIKGGAMATRSLTRR